MYMGEELSGHFKGKGQRDWTVQVKRERIEYGKYSLRA